MLRFFYIPLAVVSLGALIPAHAGSITIDPTFDSSLTTLEQGAINGAILEVEGDISSPNNISVNIYFTSMSGGLGESRTSIYQPTYDQYYNALKAVATQPDQLTALASLGTAPTGSGSANPVNGSTAVDITSAEGRNLGFGTPGTILPNSNILDATGGGTFDSEISLNTSITSPPNNLSGFYGLEAVANHEIDESLGIGGTGSTLGNGDPTGAVGDLDLYRYTCNISTATLVATLTCPAGDVSRSYSTGATTNPDSYFSINGGLTVLSFFNQTAGADYSDWFSNCNDMAVCQTDGLPNGFNPQVQDAFGEPGTNPALGVNELVAFNAIGYDVIAAPTPEPSSLPLAGLGGLGLVFMLVRRKRTAA